MTPEDIKAVVHEVLAEQKLAVIPVDMDTATLKTIATLLTSFGIEEDDRKELKADFSYLRRWRKSAEQVQGFTFKAIVTIIVGGILGAFWMGFKTLVGK